MEFLKRSKRGMTAIMNKLLIGVVAAIVLLNFVPALLPTLNTSITAYAAAGGPLSGVLSYSIISLLIGIVVVVAIYKYFTSGNKGR